MHISKLTLTNFRGATSLPIDLHARLNVFVGLNGSGKSSVLDAGAIMLSWMVSRIKHAGATSGRPIREVDIRNGESTANLEIVCKHNGSYFGWNLAKTRMGYKRKDAVSVLIAMTEVAKQLQSEITESKERVNLPLFAYYPVNRAVLDIPLRIRGRHRFDLLSAYEGALTTGASFRTFFEWFREREDLENEYRVLDSIGGELPDGVQLPDKQLECVRLALKTLMPEFKRLTVCRQPLRMEVMKNGVTLTVNQLSDGEKCLMAMVGDLASRLAIANPVNPSPLEGEGVVMIDEIDLHLHPRWQRMVVPKLMEVFPNCQFLVSTHSPHVITHVQPENLYLLRMTDEGMICEQPDESYGKTVDRVLEDLMELKTTRPDAVNIALQRIYDEIDQGELEAAKSSIGKLQKQIGEDPDLVKASVLIKRKELIGK